MSENKLTPQEWHALVAALVYAEGNATEFTKAAGTYGMDGLKSLMQKLGSGEFQR